MRNLFQKPRFIAGFLLGLTFAAGVAYAATQTLSLGASTGPGGFITLFGSTSGSATIGTPAVAGSGTVFNVPGGNGTSGQVLSTDGSGNSSWIGFEKPLTFTWASGMNLSGANLPLYLSTASGTVANVSCVPETLVGGTATLQVFYAPSGTLLSSGTKINTTDCNANTGATTTQTMGVTTAAVPANSWVGIVVPTNTAWSTSTGSGAIKIGFSNP